MLLKKEESQTGSPFMLMALTSFLVAIILFFQIWRTTAFDTSEGIGYLVFLFLLVLIILKIYFELQKLVAKKLGYAIAYKPNNSVLLISILLGFIFKGYLFLIFLGESQLELQGNLRLGKFRPDLHIKDLAVVSMIAPAFTLVLALILSGINSAAGNPLFYEAVKINVFFSLFLLMPCPNNPGLNIFLWNKKVHLAMIVAALLFAVLLVPDFGVIIPLFISLFIALLLGFIEYIPKIIYS